VECHFGDTPGGRYPGQVVGSQRALVAPRGSSPQALIEEFHMAAVCDICAKGPGFGKSVSHSHRRTSRRWDPNIQTVRAVDRPGGNKKRINVCTSCIKAGKVSRG
jgi:large subunit ribosomal protein L28